MFILELERYYTSQVYNVVFKLNAKLHHVQHHVVATLEHKNEHKKRYYQLSIKFLAGTILRKMNVLEMAQEPKR